MALKKQLNWKKKQQRVRRKIQGKEGRPRLCVSKSNRYLVVQLINDEKAVTLLSASTQEAAVGGGKNVATAKRLGALIAERAKAKKVKDVVFDRNGYLYHGRVKAIAEGAREAGLRF